MTNVKLSHRRQFLHLVAGVAALPAVSCGASAQSYPARSVRVIVGYAPGGGTDIFARLLCQALTERLGQTFIVENRPGASSNLATEAVVRAPADGYTLIATDGAAAVNATLYDRLNFNFVRDIAIVGMGRAPLVMVVHPSFPAKTFVEFISYAKANPGKITMGSAGIGSPPHIAGEMLKLMAGIDMIHVPYRGGGPVTSDLLGGQVGVAFNGLQQSVEYIRTGRLRALAVSAIKRSPAVPEVPAIHDFLTGYDLSTWYTLGPRKDTPVDTIDKLNREINAALVDPKLTARLVDTGIEPFLESSANLGKFVAAETEKLGKVIRAANIKPE
jgi:tripartite-type tricarboxylate transporter receptor subunit TctC